MRQFLAGRAAREADSAPVSDAHIQIRSLAKLVTVVIAAVPATPQSGSPRQKERDALRSTSGGGGRTRAKLLDELSAECHLLTSNLLLVADGVADCFELAAQRDDVVNWPVLTIVVRPVLEIAGQIAWLLDDTIDGAERARRFIQWRFADLRARRLLLREFRPPDDPAALAEVDAHEQELLDACAAAKWVSVPSTTGRNGAIEAAGLLADNGKREKMPSLTEMVRLVSSTSSLYNMLSIAAHGARLGTMFGLDVSDAVDRAGRRTVQVGGFGLEPNLAIGLTTLALSGSGRRIGGWNGLDTVGIYQTSAALLKRCGIG